MNWRWLIPIWGLKIVLDDDLANSNNDYMKIRLPLILFYQIGVGSFLLLTNVAMAIKFYSG